jgi:hypothetical protein
MNIARLLLALVACCSAGDANPGTHQLPRAICHGSSLLGGSRVVCFSLFSEPGGGSRYYCETQTVTLVDGYFSTHSALPTACGRPLRRLHERRRVPRVQIDGTVLSPRERLVAVPMAAVAAAVVPGAIGSAGDLGRAIATADLANGASQGAAILNGTVAAAALADGGGAGRRDPGRRRRRLDPDADC